MNITNKLPARFQHERQPASQPHQVELTPEEQAWFDEQIAAIGKVEFWSEFRHRMKQMFFGGAALGGLVGFAPRHILPLWAQVSGGIIGGAIAFCVLTALPVAYDTWDLCRKYKQLQAELALYGIRL